MMRLVLRRWRLLLLGVLAIVAIVLVGLWKQATDQGGQKPAEPFRIAGNLYYVGANDVTSFLITGPQGHVLIDGGYPGTAPMIMASIAKLGFDVRDVKILLNSHAHFDHAGGLAELQKASGAQVWVSDGDADMLASGGDDPELGIARAVIWSGLARYPAPRVDRRFGDGEVVRLGPIALTAHVTLGHTRGCTSWSFHVEDKGRALNVVHVCSVEPPAALFLMPQAAKAGLREDFARTLATLRALPADIFVTSHAKNFGRWRKYEASLTAADPVQAFIDPGGYRSYLDDGEKRVAAALAD